MGFLICPLMEREKNIPTPYSSRECPWERTVSSFCTLRKGRGGGASQVSFFFRREGKVRITRRGKESAPLFHSPSSLKKRREKENVALLPLCPCSGEGKGDYCREVSAHTLPLLCIERKRGLLIDLPIFTEGKEWGPEGPVASFSLHAHGKKKREGNFMSPLSPLPLGREGEIKSSHKEGRHGGHSSQTGKGKRKGEDE